MPFNIHEAPAHAYTFSGQDTPSLHHSLGLGRGNEGTCTIALLAVEQLHLYFPRLPFTGDRWMGGS